MAETFLEPSVTWDVLGRIAFRGWEPIRDSQCAHLLRGPAKPRLVREESARRVYLGRPTPARLRTASCMPKSEHL